MCLENRIKKWTCKPEIPWEQNSAAFSSLHGVVEKSGPSPSNDLKSRGQSSFMIFAQYFLSSPFCRNCSQVARCTWISSINNNKGSNFKDKWAGFEAADMTCMWFFQRQQSLIWVSLLILSLYRLQGMYGDGASLAASRAKQTACKILQDGLKPAWSS